MVKFLTWKILKAVNKLKNDKNSEIQLAALTIIPVVQIKHVI